MSRSANKNMKQPEDMGTEGQRILSDLHPLQIEIYRGMDAGWKLQIAMDLLRIAREMKRAGLRLKKPSLSNAAVEELVSRAFLYGT